MSREFGSYVAGYFHDQIDTCAIDALNGRCEITRKWGAVLKALYPIAYSISSAETGDSGEYDPILKSIEQINNVRAALDEVQDYLQPFKDVAREAVRKATEDAQCRNK